MGTNDAVLKSYKELIRQQDQQLEVLRQENEKLKTKSNGNENGTKPVVDVRKLSFQFNSIFF